MRACAKCQEDLVLTMGPQALGLIALINMTLMTSQAGAHPRAEVLDAAGAGGGDKAGVVPCG